MNASPISAGGLGSGYADFFATVVDSVVQRDQDMFGKPLIRKEMETNTLISSYGTLKGALGEFQQALYDISDPNTFSAKGVAISDPTLLTATASSAVSNGQHTVEIIQVAKPQISRTPGYADPDTVSVGAGTLTFTSEQGGTFSITCAAGDDNLNHMATLINENPENTFLTASVQKIDDPDNPGEFLYRLVWTGTQTGMDNQFTVQATEDPSGSGLSNFVVLSTTAAQDAKILLDGGSLTQSSNTITDALRGLTMTIIPPADESELPQSVTLTISTQITASSAAVGKFMTSYNKFINTLNELSKVAPPALEPGENDSSGPLSRETLVAQLKYTLGDYGLLKKFGDLGIGLSAQSGGNLPPLEKISVGSTFLLDQQLKADFDQVVDAFTNTADGIGTRLKRIVQNALRDSDTVIQQDLNPKLKRIKKDQEVLNDRLTKTQDRLRNQFIKLDIRLTEMNATKQSLTNWTNSLKRDK